MTPIDSPGGDFEDQVITGISQHTQESEKLVQFWPL
jgi:hypothetical protein